MTKRTRTSPSESQTTSSSASQPSQQPPKRRRTLPPPPQVLVPPTPSDPVPATSTSTLPIPPPPPKRVQTPGTLRRLAHALHHARGVQPRSTLAGSRVGGKSKDLNIVGEGVEEMWVTRKGMGFPGYLKKGVAAFLERGVTKLSIRGMGAAIPVALSLALAIRDAVPGGEAGEDEVGAIAMAVRTGSFVVSDEITPDDEDEDLVYQTRTKSTVEVDLTVSVSLGNVRVQATGGGRGGSKGQRGTGGRGSRGRGTGRGRGRGVSA